MARGKVKAAVLLGAVGTAFGAYLVYDNVYAFYRAQDVPPVLGIFGAGVLLLAIGVGALKHPALGLVPLLLGGGYAVAMLQLGKQHLADRMQGYGQEIEIQKAAAAVCDGKPNTAAADTLIDGKRPILGAGRASGASDWFSGGAAWADLPKPRTLAELHLVACTQRLDDLRAKCDYVGKDGVGAYSISRYRRVDSITVRLAKTAAVLGEKTFEGGEPSTNCSDSIQASLRESNFEVSGSEPDAVAETAFVRAFVEHP